MPIIMTDSTSDFSLEQANELGIEMLSLKVNFDHDSYEDKRTISSEEFYEKLKQSKNLPTTSLIGVGDFLQAFSKYPTQEIVVITLSSKLSGTFQSAEIAKEESGRQDIYLIDSGTITVGMAMLVKLAVKMRDEGKSGSEIASQVREYAKRTRIYAVMDTLLYLVKGGRLSGVQGALGSVFSLKPILTIVDGSLSTLAKARGMDKGLQTMLDFINKEGNLDPTMPVGFAHSLNIPKMRQLQEIMKPEIIDGEYVLGSVVGTHAGPGAVIVSFFSKE
jgi:DegV family protein with EDD domain